jgi:2-haloacid dehalogenase
MPDCIDQPCAIVFDFGGVLIDWDPLYLYAKLFNGDRQAAQRFLEKIGFHEWNRRQDAGRPFSEAVEVLCTRFPTDCELIRAYDHRWRESIAGPIHATVNIMHDLRLRGYPLYGLSNWSAEKFHLVRREYEFFDWFEDIVISGEVSLVKPDPQIFVLLLEKIDRPAQACLLIDDTQANIDIARQLGFRTFYFRSPDQLRSELCRSGVLDGEIDCA